MKKFLLLLVVIVVVVLSGVLIFALSPTRTRVIAIAAGKPDAALIERGRYLAIAGDCTACHTRPGSEPFAGGLPIASPIGTIYSSNITPDRETGIGGYSLDVFDRAVRHGIGSKGGTLYPAMPYPSYARLSDEDVHALYAYFMQGVTAVKAAGRPNDIPWPMSMRWPVAIWRKILAPNPDAVAFRAEHYPDPVTARGAYLVQGLGHCGSCHTPRAPTLQEKALDEAGADYLAGGAVIDGWLAVNLRGDSADGLGAWTQQDIIDTLRSARNRTRAVIGSPMNDVVVHSTQHLSEDDLKAVAAYLKTLSPSSHSPSTFSSDRTTARALAAGTEEGRGAQLFVDNCAACHRTDGQGYPGVFPKIAGNSSVLAADGESMIRLVLQGSRLPSTAAAPSELGMPGFGWRLSDEEVAQLVSFVRQGWGNRAPAVTSAQVQRIRKGLRTPSDHPAIENLN